MVMERQRATRARKVQVESIVDKICDVDGLSMVCWSRETRVVALNRGERKTKSVLKDQVREARVDFLDRLTLRFVCNARASNFAELTMLG